MDKQLKTLEKEINSLEEKILSKKQEIIVRKLNIIESKKDDKVLLEREEWEILRKYLEENGDQTFCKMQHEFSMEDDQVFDDYYETVVKLGNRYISVFDGIKEVLNNINTFIFPFFLGDSMGEITFSLIFNVITIDYIHTARFCNIREILRRFCDCLLKSLFLSFFLEF